MKLSCTQENFRMALSTVERIVGKQSTLPILSNLLLETEKGQLKISATNLEIGVVTSIGAKIEREGKSTLPAKLLMQFVQNLALDQIIELEQIGTQIILRSGNYTVRMNSLESKDFPIIPERTEEKVFSVPADALRNGLQKTLFCVSLNESRPELTGVLLRMEGEKLWLTATDSFRLAEWQLTQGIEGDRTALSERTTSVIVPVYTLQEVLRVIAQGGERVMVAIEENQVFFEIQNTRIVSRLINGKYPEYQAIVPKQYSAQVTLAQEEFQRALKIATSFSTYTTGEVEIQIHAKEQQLEINSTSQSVGEQQAKLSFEGTVGEDIKLVFNPRHLLEGAVAISGVDCILSINAPTTPVRLSATNEAQGYTYIIMPLRK